MDSIYMDKQGVLAVSLGEIQQCNFSLGDIPGKVFFFRDPMVKPVGVISTTAFSIYQSETLNVICTFIPGLNKLVVLLNTSAPCFCYVFSWGAELIWGVEMSLGWNLAEITVVGEGEGSEQVITVLNHSPVSAQEVPSFLGVLLMDSADAVTCANTFLNAFDDGTLSVYSNDLQRFVPSSFVNLALFNAFVKSMSADISDAEVLANKVTEISDDSTDDEYPSAKCVYDELSDVVRDADITDVVRTDDIIDVVRTDDIIDVVRTDDITDVVRTDDITDVVRTDDITDVVRDADITDVVRTGDITDVVRTGDITDVVRTGDITDVVRTDDIADFLVAADVADFLVADDISGLAPVVPVATANATPLVSGKLYAFTTDADITLTLPEANTVAPILKEEIVVFLGIVTNTITITMAGATYVKSGDLPTAPGNYKLTFVYDPDTACGLRWYLDVAKYV